MESCKLNFCKFADNMNGFKSIEYAKVVVFINISNYNWIKETRKTQLLKICDAFEQESYMAVMIYNTSSCYALKYN